MKSILRILEKDARTSPEQIAVMTGKSVEEVKRIIERAEKEGIILRYKTMINWEKVGEEQVAALIEVKVAPQRDVGFEAIARRIYRFSETRSVYFVSGTYDLVVEIVGKSMKEVATFVAEKLAPLDTVQGTVTHFLLKRYKEDGVILEGLPEETKRLPVIP